VGISQPRSRWSVMPMRFLQNPHTSDKATPGRRYYREGCHQWNTGGSWVQPQIVAYTLDDSVSYNPDVRGSLIAGRLDYYDY